MRSRPHQSPRVALGLPLALLLACGDSDGRGDADTGVTGASGVTAATTATTATTMTTLTGVTTVTTDSAGSTGGEEGGTDPTTGGAVGECDESCPKGQFCDPMYDLCLPAPCVDVEECGPGQLCTDGFCGEACAAQEFTITLLAPNMLIVLDRTDSMGDDIDGSSRWNVAKEAIGAMVDSFGTEIRFGLNTFSSCTGDECSPGSIVVPIGNNNAGPIKSFLANKLDESSSNGKGMSGNNVKYLCDSGMPETSTGITLTSLVGEQTLQDPARTNAVLLVTDGEDACGPPNAQEGAATLYNQPKPTRTYVIGFSDDVNGDTLNEVATAGGTSAYYPANSLDELKAAFELIAASAASCDYLLDVAPEDLAEMFVFFNDLEEIDPDAVNGWTYDANTMTLRFVGAACQQLQSGTVSDIDVVFGCAMPVPG